MNNKKIKKTSTQKKHIFQVHTMHTDNEAKAAKLVDSRTDLSPKENNLHQINKKEAVLQPQSRSFKQSKQQTNSPFLTNDVPKNIDAKKGTFAPNVQKETVEKINQTPADIVSSKKNTQKETWGNSEKNDSYCYDSFYHFVSPWSSWFWCIYTKI